MKGINKTENNHIAQIKIKEGVIICPKHIMDRVSITYI
jgi:hypothetical protein